MGDNSQFYLNFALFSTLGRMNLDLNFLQVSKLSEDQKKGLHQKWNNFFPEFKWTPALRCTPESNYWGECRCRPYSNYWGDTPKLFGEIYPPWVSAPLLSTLLYLQIKFKTRLKARIFGLNFPIASP